MQIKPTPDVLAAWVSSYVPTKDLFFLTEEHYKKGGSYLDVIVMPSDEFFNHSTYSQINYVNSCYEY